MFHLQIAVVTLSVTVSDHIQILSDFHIYPTIYTIWSKWF